MEKIDKKGLGIVLISSSIVISLLLIYRSTILVINNYYNISITLMIIFILNLISKLGFYFLNNKNK